MLMAALNSIILIWIKIRNFSFTTIGTNNKGKHKQMRKKDSLTYILYILHCSSVFSLQILVQLVINVLVQLMIKYASALLKIKNVVLVKLHFYSIVDTVLIDLYSSEINNITNINIYSIKNGQLIVVYSMRVKREKKKK